MHYAQLKYMPHVVVFEWILEPHLCIGKAEYIYSFDVA